MRCNPSSGEPVPRLTSYISRGAELIHIDQFIFGIQFSRYRTAISLREIAVEAPLRGSSPVYPADSHQPSGTRNLRSCSLIAYAIINKSGSRLLFHTVSSIVPSAVQVLTVVFGMRTGVAPARIATRQICFTYIRHSHEMLRISDWSRPEALRALSAPGDEIHLPVNQFPVRCLSSPGVPDF